MKFYLTVTTIVPNRNISRMVSYTSKLPKANVIYVILNLHGVVFDSFCQICLFFCLDSLQLTVLHLGPKMAAGGQLC